MIQKKIDQLTQEKVTIKESYQNVDMKNDELKYEIKEKHSKLVEQQESNIELLKSKDLEIEKQEQDEKAMKVKYEKMVSDMIAHIEVVKLGQEKVSK